MSSESDGKTKTEYNGDYEKYIGDDDSDVDNCHSDDTEDDENADATDNEEPTPKASSAAPATANTTPPQKPLFVSTPIPSDIGNPTEEATVWFNDSVLNVCQMIMHDATAKQREAAAKGNTVEAKQWQVRLSVADYQFELLKSRMNGKYTK
ncbi:MAG: hypothetical protein IJ677_02495 [Alphaproteobacteria bacterium]|nr:hypothetical protein [Alphaproteobacteria bacterium]